MDPEATRLEKEVAAERRARLDLERQLAELTARQHQRQAMVKRTSGGGGGAGEYRAPGDYAAFGAASSRSHAASHHAMSHHAMSHHAAAWEAPAGGREASRGGLARHLSTRQSRSPSRSRSRSTGRSSGRSSGRSLGSGGPPPAQVQLENHDKSGGRS